MKYIYAENVSFINAYWPMHFVTSCSVLTLRARFDQGLAMAYGSIYLWAKIWLSKLSGLTHRLLHNFSLVWNGHVLSNASNLPVIIDSRKSSIALSIELSKYFSMLCNFFNIYRSTHIFRCTKMCCHIEFKYDNKSVKICVLKKKIGSCQELIIVFHRCVW